MSCSRIYDFNLATQDVNDISANAENAFFPASNLRDYRSTKVFRTPDGVLSAQVLFDMKTAEPVDAIFIVGSKLDGFGFSSVTVEANITANFDAPLFSTTLDIDNKFNMAFKDLSATKPEYRFWRVVISGGAPYVELSHVFIGREVEVGRSTNFNWSFQNNDLTTTTTNRSGQQFKDIRNKQKEIRLSYGNLAGKTEFAVLQDALDGNGEANPFWIIMDPEETFSDNKHRFAGPFFLDRVPQIKNTTFARFGVNSLRFLEAI